VRDFMELRRGNSGVDVAFSVIECILSIDLDPEVFDHPTMSTLRRLAGQMVYIINVSLSWALSRSKIVGTDKAYRTSAVITKNRLLVMPQIT
jgi:hypothetical protein